MIDTNVVRLRQLRATALKARALAAAMDSRLATGDTVLSRSAVSCWRIARIVTGRLRAHPYLSYQRDASAVSAVFNRVNSHLLAGVAQHRGKSLRTFSAELKRLAREVDNARALTWSADLSDSLGRSQAEIRRLIKEVEAGARKERGSLVESAGGVANDMRTDAGTGSLAANWPYLAF